MVETDIVDEDGREVRDEALHMLEASAAWQCEVVPFLVQRVGELTEALLTTAPEDTGEVAGLQASILRYREMMSLPSRLRERLREKGEEGKQPPLTPSAGPLSKNSALRRPRTDGI